MKTGRRKLKMVNNTNKVDAIIIHCSATREGQDIGAKEIDAMHKQRGFNGIGYHYVIRLDGTVEPGRSETAIGAHCNTKGFSRESYNRHSIGICYVGGLDKNGKAKDTRTPEQRSSMHLLVAQLLKRFKNNICICGHRDLSPDLNGDGVIEPEEWIKECPCFEVSREL